MVTKMLKMLFEKSISYIKKRPFRFHSNISSGDLVYLACSQIFPIIRGFIKFRKLVSIGPFVTIVSKRNLRMGRGVTIKNNTTLDALGKVGLTIGDSSSVGSYCILRVSGSYSDLGDRIQIGKNVGLGDFAHIGGAGGVVIGDETIIGAYFSVHPENHNFDDLDTPIRAQGVNHQGITIGSNCWVGAKVTILDGSKVGDGCVIAAGAVVKGEFPDNAIIGGVPAKILKYR